jgi:hypothetical protein
MYSKVQYPAEPGSHEPACVRLHRIVTIKSFSHTVYLKKNVHPPMIPFSRIIDETLAQARGGGVADLCRLKQAVGYWAPEVKENWFWYGHGGILGYQDILNIYFKDNREIRGIYTGFLEAYYKDNRVEE